MILKKRPAIMRRLKKSIFRKKDLIKPDRLSNEYLERRYKIKRPAPRATQNAKNEKRRIGIIRPPYRFQIKLAVIEEGKRFFNPT